MDILQPPLNLLHRFVRLLRTELGITIGLAVVVGVVAGLGAVAFREMISGLQWLFFDGGAGAFGFMGDYYVIILPAIGGIFVGLLVYFLAREAKGHGVPEVMAAVAARGGRIRYRVSVVASLASSICIGSGGSTGREGPIVLIGSSLGSTVGQWFKLHEDWIKTLVACGAAGGISATFNAPIAGVFFAHEVILSRFITISFIPVVISSVAATMIAQVFLGAQRMFVVPEYTMVSSWEILLYVLLGITAGIVAFLFIRTLYKSEDLFDAWKFPNYLKPAVGGIIVGLIGLYSYAYSSDPLSAGIFGVGYGTDHGSMSAVLSSDLTLGLGLIAGLLVLKLIATSVTLGSGGSGGIFAPALFMGSMLGGTLGIAFHKLFPSITAPYGAYSLVGMAAVFGGAARAPITAIIIIFEMTRDYRIILPLMLAVVISTLVARGLSRESIYTLKVRRMGINLGRREESALMRRITVGEVMSPDFPTVSPEMPVAELTHMLAETGHHGFPVVDEEGHLCGVVTLTDIQAAMSRGEGAQLTVGDIATKKVIVAYPDQSVHDALAQFGGRDVGRIPVVDRNEPTKLLGVLRRHDIVRSYTKAAGESERTSQSM
jgi:CIC family chloride channel protein